MNATHLGALALLSDGRPRSATEIFRKLYESRISVRGLRRDLPPGPNGRLRALLEPGWLDRVHDRNNSFFLTPRGRTVLRQEQPRLESEFEQLRPRLVAEIEREIGDARQARMFATSRLSNIGRLTFELERDSSKSGLARLLRFAIVTRLRHLLDSPRGTGHAFMKAVHDQVTDYFYSRIMTLMHEDAAAREIALDGLRFETAQPGLEHAQLRTRSSCGPVFLNVLRIDPHLRTLRVEDVSRRERDERYITAIAQRTGALAVVSAGYFIFSEKSYRPPTRQFDPVGLCLVDGRLTQPPVFRRGSLLVSSEGRVTFRRVGLDQVRVSRGGASARLRAVTRPPIPSEGISALNRVWGSRVETNDPERLLLAVVNGVETERSRTALDIPLNGFVLSVPAPMASAFEATAPLKLTLDESDLPGIRYAVAAGPLLLEAGQFVMNYAREDFQEGTPPVTFSGDRTIDRNLIPRCGIGTTGDGRIIMAIVDGRQPHLSVGATLAEFATLLGNLGVVDALNLDGGGTAAMQLGDRVVSNPSTSVRFDARGRAEPARTNAEKNVRPLATAILVD